MVRYSKLSALIVITAYFLRDIVKPNMQRGLENLGHDHQREIIGIGSKSGGVKG